MYLVITPFFPTEEVFRGPFIYDQVQAILRTKRYQDVIVFMPTKIRDQRKTYVYRGITVYLFPYIQMPSYFLNGFFNRINSWLFLRAFRSFGFRAKQIAVAHAHTGPLAICALILKKFSPSLLTVVQHHDADPLTIRNGIGSHWEFNARYRARKSRHILNQVDCHVSVSQFVERHLLEFPHDNPIDYFDSYRRSLALVQGLSSVVPQHSLVLYNGVDCSQFHPASNPPSRPGNQLIIGCVGNFVDLKDQMTLIKAVQLFVTQHSDVAVSLKLVGSGPMLQTCRDYVAGQGLEAHVDFLQEVPHPSLLPFYQSLDLFILPSFFEGLGCVLLESHACGVPFMTCHHQGGAEFISPGEEGLWLFAPGDYQHLARLIHHFHQFRPKQTLCHDYDIDTLIPRFLDQIDLLQTQKHSCRA